MPAILALLVGLVVAAHAPAAPPEASWSLRDGDRVVFLGDALVEREGRVGAIETALVATHPGLGLEFRNLGWSGDTVWAEARGVFDAPSAGYARMIALVRDLHPAVVIVAYGRNESFAGEAGLEAFRGQLARLVADLRGTAAGEAPVRIVLVTPPPFEAVPPLSAAAAAARTAALGPYAAAIRDLAAREGTGLVDLFADAASRVAPGRPLTDNGTHLSAAGFDAAAEIFAESCGKTLSGDFPGRSAALRAAVVAKNDLFFHRWRPANETYLFLFRRHEQGNNAAEIPRFDPLVEAAEERVRRLAEEVP